MGRLAWRRLLGGGQDHDVDAAVELASFHGVIAGGGMKLGVSRSRQPVGGDAVLLDKNSDQSGGARGG